MRGATAVVPGEAVAVSDLAEDSSHGVAGKFAGVQVSIRSSPFEDGFWLELAYQGATYQLYSTEWSDDGSWQVHWIGDLNRDGFPDVPLSATDKYSVHTLRLLLSEPGEPGLRKVATFTHTAC